jgi:hypothetical protein
VGGAAEILGSPRFANNKNKVGVVNSSEPPAPAKPALSIVAQLRAEEERKANRKIHAASPERPERRKAAPVAVVAEQRAEREVYELEPGKNLEVAPAEYQTMSKRELLQAFQAEQAKAEDYKRYLAGLKRNVTNLTTVNRRDQMKMKNLSNEITERDATIRTLEALVAAQKKGLQAAIAAKAEADACASMLDEKKTISALQEVPAAQTTHQEDPRVADLESRLAMMQKNSKNLVAEVKKLRASEQMYKEAVDQAHEDQMRIGHEKRALQTKVAELEKIAQKQAQRSQADADKELELVHAKSDQAACQKPNM